MSFDAIAPWYRSLEWIAFGDELQRCRVACLGEMAAPRRALIVGEGNGRFLIELLRLHATVEVDCLEASERMLTLARERIERELPEWAPRVRFLHEDITFWEAPAHQYDLVVTHFVLDCFREAEVAAIVKKLAGAATADANWFLADFRVPEKPWLRFKAKIWLAVMYKFFRATAGIDARRLIDATPFLQAEDFALVCQHHFLQGMLKSEMWTRFLARSS